MVASYVGNLSFYIKKKLNYDIYFWMLCFLTNGVSAYVMDGTWSETWYCTNPTYLCEVRSPILEHSIWMLELIIPTDNLRIFWLKESVMRTYWCTCVYIDDVYIRIIYPVYLYSDVYFKWIPLKVSFVLVYNYWESLSIDMTQMRQLDDQWSKWIRIDLFRSK